MSSTKVLIVVLILIVLLFVFFVVYGAFSPDDRSGAAGFKAPGWSKALGSLISSAKPKVELKKKIYSESTEEIIAPDDKQPFRTATFHLLQGRASIEYEDQTENAVDELKEQECELPDFDMDDPRRCSIVALKKGGKL